MRLLMALCGVLFATSALAQSEAAPTDFRMRLYPQATPTVLRWESPVLPIGPPVAVCGQDPKPGLTGIVINPQMLQFNDPMLTGKVCLVNLAGAAPAPVEDGIYEFALVGVRSGLVGTTESARLMLSKGTVTIRVLSGVMFVSPQ